MGFKINTLWCDLRNAGGEHMKIVKCLCGWRGPDDVYRFNGKPSCPLCARELFTIKCDGCSEWV